MKVTLELGRACSKEAGLSRLELEMRAGASAGDLLLAAGAALPALSCVDRASGAVDLAAANLSVNGRPVDPRTPERTALQDGDRCYLYGVMSGG
ncbi:MAG TPA: hypothetical protein VJ547_00665 [Candidatus Thermoplasmatota archaeon]|nr:hypothetical protein [Candidatus Thermoplasmatota archaeon]